MSSANAAIILLTSAAGNRAWLVLLAWLVFGLLLHAAYSALLGLRQLIKRCRRGRHHHDPPHPLKSSRNE